MVVNDGFGEVSEWDEGLLLADYHKWLHYIAYKMTDDDSIHDDLVQEGRIAMWRAMQTHDPDKGALPSWVTTAAKQRMKDFLYGHGQPTGREATRGSREVETDTSVDALLEEGLEAALGVSEALEGVELSYHHGEILKALATLSPSQREYVFLRFWGGMDPSTRVPEMRRIIDQFPILKKRFLWTGTSKQVGAKDRLREALSHLVEV